MSTYTVKVQPTVESGSYSTTVTEYPMETKEENALWDYNSCRAHDGLPPLRRMPAGTTYERVYEYEIQGFYSGAWEAVTTEENRKAAKEQAACYRENEPGTSFRIKRVAL